MKTTLAQIFLLGILLFGCNSTIYALDTPILSSPANGATDVSLTPTLYWEPVEGAGWYVSFVEGAWSAVVTGTSATVPVGELTEGTTYSWKVRPCTDSSCHTIYPYSAARTFTTETLGSLSAPILISPNNNATNVSLTPTFFWQPVYGASSYVINIEGAWSAIVTGTSATVPAGELTGGTSYFWRVRACPSDGCSIINPWSSSWKITTISSETTGDTTGGTTGDSTTSECTDLGGYCHFVSCCSPYICKNDICVQATGGSTTSGDTTQSDYTGGGITIKNPLNVDNFPDLIDALINFIFWVGITLAPIMLIIAGLIFVTSSGSPEKVTTAKNFMIWTLVGLAVLLLAKGLVAVIKSILGV
jgi:hypothetical protein